MRLTELIKEQGLNRVVVASCTPRTHEPLFQDTLRGAGLNPYLFEMANIREHDSWVHKSVPQSATADFLAQVSLFAVLSRSELLAIAARFRENTYPAGATLFHESDPAARFWLVRAGQAKIVKYGEGGREIVLEVISPGEVFGSATMLMPAQPATAQALTDLTTLSLSVDEYRRLLHDFPLLGVRIIETLGERFVAMVQMRVMAGERVERRIAHILLKLAAKCGQPTPDGLQIGISLSRQDIAELADTTTETAIRVMSRLNREGLVKTLRGGYVVLRDPDALQRLIGG